MGTRRITVHLPHRLLDHLDALVGPGRYSTRADAVCAGIEILAERQQRQDDDAIVEGYRSVPTSQAEMDAAMSSLRDAIAEEPW